MRECSKNNPALVSQFMNQSLSLLHPHDHLPREDAGAATCLPELHPIQDGGQKSSNNSASHSMDESSSTEESLSRRSNSPPANTAAAVGNLSHRRYSASDHIGDLSVHPRLADNVVELSSCGRIAYLSSTQMNEANPLSAYPEDNSVSPVSPLQELPAVSGSELYFRNSSEYKEFRSHSPILSRPRQLNHPASRPVPQPRSDNARWLQASRMSAVPHEHQEFLNTLPLSRFGSEVQNQFSQTGHATEVSYMHETSDACPRPQPSSKLDIRINLGFNQPSSMPECTYGYRAFSGPLTTTSSPVPTGATGSILDITSQQALSGYTSGQYSTSIGPNNVNLSGFNTTLSGTPTGIRLHEYEVPSPRMVLWDFQE